MFNRTKKDTETYPVSLPPYPLRTVCDVEEQMDPFLGEIFVQHEPFGAQLTPEWEPTVWWRVIARNGSLKLETRYEDEAREAWMPGEALQRLYQKTDEKWVTEP